MRKSYTAALFFVVSGCLHTLSHAQTTPAGGIAGSAWEHSPQSLSRSVEQADLCLPASVTGKSVVCGKFKDVAAQAAGTASRVPVVVFLHGSSGLGLKAIGEWQRWLAQLGYASLAPDSFALPERVTYKSPIDKKAYERIHAMRAAEISPAVAALQTQAWADMQRLVLAGTSEGAVAVSRHASAAFVGRIIYAWSCEDNYFVDAAQSAFPAQQPVLNVISSVDPYFSNANSWLGSASAKGHCGAALAASPQSAVVLVPGAPHTLLNWPAAKMATAGFLKMLFPS